MATPKKTRGLGRGLDALFADQAPISEGKKIEDKAAAQSSENAVLYIDINDIKPNENQPRKIFDEDKIEELADSILQHGIIQPLVVRKSKSGYEIVAGERRWRASRKAQLKEVPCIIREFSDEENMLVAIVENMQREDLNPVEEAEGLHQMIATYGLTQNQVSKSVSKSRPYITNSLRLLKLPVEIQDMISEGSLTTGHARALIPVEDQQIQKEIAAKIVRENLSVRKVEELISQLGKKKVKRQKKSKGADTLKVESELKDIFGTKISINQRGKKGTIEFEYYSREELNRLIEILKTAK